MIRLDALGDLATRGAPRASTEIPPADDWIRDGERRRVLAKAETVAHALRQIQMPNVIAALEEAGLLLYLRTDDIEIVPGSVSEDGQTFALSARCEARAETPLR